MNSTGFVEPDEPIEPEKQVDIGQSAARELGKQDWQLDAEAEIIPEQAAEIATETTTEQRTPDTLPFRESIPQALPPTPIQILEALLFLGGQPIRTHEIMQIIRGVSDSDVRSLVEQLQEKYRQQNRPYRIESSDIGYRITIRNRYRSIQTKMSGSPREARLSQPTLDVLSLIAYRQPITRAEIDSLRGADSNALIRTLVRLNLVTMLQRTESDEKLVYYHTTPRFLELFGLRSLDDLPTLGEAEPI